MKRDTTLKARVVRSMSVICLGFALAPLSINCSGLSSLNSPPDLVREETADLASNGSRPFTQTALSRDALFHGTGREAQDCWTVAPGLDEAGHFIYGPYATNWNDKSIRASFMLTTSVRNTSHEVAFDLDVYDATAGEVLASRVFRGLEIEPGQRLPYTIAVDIVGRQGHAIETRLHWKGHVDLNFYGVQYEFSDIRLGLPKIINASGVDDGRAENLVRAAINGMGFQGSLQGPNANDVMFVGRYYVAWLDQTGFVGKMNGLWTLNGDLGNLDFTLRDQGRVVNMLGVADRGDGRFMPGYRGAEHYEIPDNVLEPWQTNECEGSGKVCNWYSFAEQPGVHLDHLPWWTSCNAANDGWGQFNAPLVENQVGGQIEIVYEGRVRKMGDNAPGFEGLRCGGDYRFPDGQIRPVYLQVGYRFRGDQPTFERIYRFRNGDGNPVFGTKAWSVINGLVLGDAVKMPPYKPFQRFFKMDRDSVTGNENTIGTSWTRYRLRDISSDDVFGWLGQGYSFGTGSDAAAHSVHVAANGSADNDDVGWCICRVHGGFEVGGGVLHQNLSLPIQGNAETAWASRRYELSTPSGESSEITSRTYLGATDFYHSTGFAEGSSWLVQADGQSRHALYGPYERGFAEGVYTAQFEIMTDNNTAKDIPIFTIDVNDASDGRILASRTVNRQQLADPGLPGLFALNFDLTDRGGHAIEFRVSVSGNSFLKINRVIVGPQNGQGDWIPRSEFNRTYFATGPSFSHAIGSAGSDGWEVAAGPSGALIYGPYVRDLPSRTLTSSFILMTDNNTDLDLETVEIDVNDATMDRVLVRRVLTRRQLPTPFQWGIFDLSIDLSQIEGHAIEFRVFAKGISYLKVKGIRVHD